MAKDIASLRWSSSNINGERVSCYWRRKAWGDDMWGSFHQLGHDTPAEQIVLAYYPLFMGEVNALDEQGSLIFYPRFAE